ncbi:MAG: hypothetical protein ACE5I3_03050 [Phycisphaerae bacterium]
MNDKDIDNLIRMAVEVEEIESLASARARETSIEDAAHQLGRPAAPTRPTIRLDRPLFRRRVWQIGLSAAAVAACVLLLLQQRLAPRAPQRAAAVSLEIDYCPGLALHDGVRIDHFEPTATEHYVVLAIFRCWHDECQCLAWRLHEWEDGRTLAEIAPGEVLDIALDVTDAPPVEQLLLVAIAQHADDLPGSEADTYGLLDCLNEVTPPTNPCDSAAAYASAMQSCLPEGVTVIPRPFFVE